MAVIGWVDTETDLDEWRDAPSDEETLARYLGAAYEQCLIYQPTVPNPLPDRFPLAQVMQARSLYNSVISGPGNTLGPDGASIQTFPMDWVVKNLLRPKTIVGPA